MKSRWILVLVGCVVAGAGCMGPQGVHDHAAMKAAPSAVMAPAEAAAPAAPAEEGAVVNIGCPVTGEKI
ncbi:MAG: hypothetical protein HZB55_18575 [Deltaproteobacteria bacterium]|nr:hypothetical protein [Deltaproteobacteria bacterium]